MLLKDVLKSLDYMTYVRLVHVNGPKRHAICFLMNDYYDENLHDDVNDAINKLIILRLMDHQNCIWRCYNMTFEELMKVTEYHTRLGVTDTYTGHHRKWDPEYIRRF